MNDHAGVGSATKLGGLELARRHDGGGGAEYRKKSRYTAVHSGAAIIQIDRVVAINVWLFFDQC
ncbi:hypothetical protein CHH28_10755 [Bacterioplanes sanyensis]|uniref:Uncharacterized protein n=1 Tax=Bacterioplanes sanyensis TaxID=1249553 RepID=A0A222FK31_9GAMM|nr:hypothetical protein CHH28_10755 [Bacterioplanes sanyensis]